MDWSHTSGLTPAFELDDLPPLSPVYEESLLRIVDEALANVLRHAGATGLDIELRREADRVRLSIIDNGRGIAADHASGMGLSNMRERAEALPGGRFELDAPPGQGTRVAVSFVVAEAPIA
jgi:signal transduction histidine kinase